MSSFNPGRGRRARANLAAGMAIATLAAAAAAPPALAGQVSVTAVVHASGQAPSSSAPFFADDVQGGDDRVAARAGFTKFFGARETSEEVTHNQVSINENVLGFGGGAMDRGQIRLSDIGPGTVGNVGLVSLAQVRDVITLQGTPAQAGRHLTLNGEFEITRAALSTSAPGVASAQFPGPPTSPGFVDADSHVTWSLAGSGVAHGDVTLAESHHGIDNFAGKIVSLDHVGPLMVPFHVDMIVGRATEVDFISEITASLSVDDLTIGAFGHDGDAGVDLAGWDVEFHWVTDTAFMTDADTGAVTHGLTVASESGFEWLGSGAGPAAAPEPSAWAMMLLGFGGLGAVLRRRPRATLA